MSCRSQAFLRSEVHMAGAKAHVEERLQSLFSYNVRGGDPFPPIFTRMKIHVNHRVGLFVRVPV